MTRSLFAVSKETHGAVLTNLVIAVRSTLLVLWFFLSCLLGCILCIFKFRSPDVPRIICSFYSPVSAWLAGIRLVQQDWHHTVDADNSAVYLANHQTFLDLSFFGQQLPKNTVCVAKSDLKWVPVSGRRAAQHASAVSDALVSLSRSLACSGMRRAMFTSIASAATRPCSRSTSLPTGCRRKSAACGSSPRARETRSTRRRW
jgi:hypothetical protein